MNQIHVLQHYMTSFTWEAQIINKEQNKRKETGNWAIDLSQKGKGAKVEGGDEEDKGKEDLGGVRPSYCREMLGLPRAICTPAEYPRTLGPRCWKQQDEEDSPLLRAAWEAAGHRLNMCPQY